MKAWNYYFLAKFYLFLRGFIRIDPLWNLLFIGFLFLPIPTRVNGVQSIRILRGFMSLAFGLLLLWHDSWLPPIRYSITFLNEQGWPSPQYILEFLSGFFNPWEVAALGLVLAVAFLSRRHLHLTPVVLLLLLVVLLSQTGQSENNIDASLDTFYVSESKRKIVFEKTLSTPPDFNVIILHICSLSWRDLEGINMKALTFFNQFHFLFKQFNSVSTYSNPTAIRLLRSNCGQLPHGALYRNSPKDCYLLDELRGNGFETSFLLNHNGEYGNFSDQVRALGHLDNPMDLPNLPAQAHSFDASPIFDDFTVLEHWWSLREQSSSKPTAVYYNSLSLHDGVHWVDNQEKKGIDRVERYLGAAQKLFSDLTRFFDLLASSNRNFVILFVPEHGMALHGNTLQVAGLRDIPFSNITMVPVGVKLIGKGYPNDEVSQEIILKPSSYLSLSSLVASFLKNSPFGSDKPDLTTLGTGLPETTFVSENEKVKIVKKEHEYFLFGKGKKWIRLSDDLLN